MVTQREITRRHIEAGRKLKSLLDPWESTDNALNALAERFPENDLESCLIKVATLNALYNTNVYAIWRMAEHVHEVLNDPAREEGPLLVDRMARLGNREHRSFASKFAHFFIDSERYPILDQYVLKMLAVHLANRRVWPKSYAEFCEWFDCLKPLCEESFSHKDLDQYLWMAGMHRQWLLAGPGILSKDVIKLFESGRPEVVAALADLGVSV